ncbi:MAG: calcium-binding protein [Actinomycetota bacterium]
MRKRNSSRDIQRSAARGALGIVLGLLAFLVASTPIGGPLTAVVTAQTASPTPTETTSPTASPSPTTPPSPIEWVNPHEETSTEISMRGDGVDAAYHLVAWVNDVPASPLVEFRYVDGTNIVSLGAATRVPGTDTWELFWTTPPDDGDYVLEALLYSGTTLVGQDQIEIEVNNQGESRTLPIDAEPQAQTVELLTPVNGGRVGFYSSGTGDAQRTRAVLNVSTSAGTRSVRVFYTMSAVGTEPVWTSCGSANKPADVNQFFVVCTLGSDGVATAVTAVAAVAREADLGLLDPLDDGIDAGDAHAATGYEQVPTAVALRPEQQTQRQDLNPAGVFPCSQVITARVLDQHGQPVFGVNTDVHATGPTDNLFFDDSDTSGDNTSRTQAPDQNAHRAEPGMNCEGEPPAFTSANQQGSHDRPPGTPDIKHIETVPSTATVVGGTNQTGDFSFQLRSLDAGETQFTVWADLDDNDQHCTFEPDASGAIGWGQDPGAVTGVDPENSDCPQPQFTPTPTQTTTPTPTQTTTPTPTQTTTPSGEKCPGHESDPRNHVVGTPDDDQLSGTEGGDVICGLGGNDQINGLGGNDLLLGGDGDDTINGDAGDDDIEGGNGDDDIDGGTGNDDIDGGDGKDSIMGGDGDDTIDGGLQNDVIIGNAGNDLLIGSRGFDVIRGGKGHDTIRGGRGRDTIRGHTGRDDIRGGRGMDTLAGGGGHDEIRGGKDDDLLRGGRGNDTLRGGGGSDACFGGAGNNRYFSCEDRA